MEAKWAKIELVLLIWDVHISGDGLTSPTAPWYQFCLLFISGNIAVGHQAGSFAVNSLEMSMTRLPSRALWSRELALQLQRWNHQCA